MKKNRMMRLASVLLICVLLTTSIISGTFAKYTTSVSSEDSARVANWGFEKSNTMDLTDLFFSSYTNVHAKANDDGSFDDVIAPGTEGQSSFQFKYDGENGTNGPEVAYIFSVQVEGSCDAAIVNNENIQWALDDNTNGWGTWAELLDSIVALSGDASGAKQYAPNTLPAGFTDADETHTIYWRWLFDETTGGQDLDEMDTDMGNATDLADCSIKITITATQVD